ncbi:hypothetical protein D3C84_795280 [compost metagenome]
MGPRVLGSSMLGRSGLNEGSTGRLTASTFSRRSTSSLLPLAASRTRGSYSSSHAWVRFSSILTTDFAAALSLLTPNGHQLELLADFSGLAPSPALSWPYMLQPDAARQKSKVEVLSNFMSAYPVNRLSPATWL